MNLKAYYHKIREVESSLVEPFVVLISHETSDGGKDGLLTEVSKAVAAKMLADGRGRLASEEATRTFQEKKAEAKRAADTEGAANRMQVTVAPAADSIKTKRFTKEQ
jgi:hypothetical protein